MPKNAADMAAALKIAGPVLDRILSRSDMSPRARSIAKLLGEGLSLADILDITPEERDTVLSSAFRSLQLGEYAKARDLLSGLVRIEPHDRRAVYALGVAQQGCDAHEEAGRSFIYAIALDARDPEAYLRLGECLLANGEREPARACFEAAKVQVGAGHGTPAALAHADRMLALFDDPAPDRV